MQVRIQVSWKKKKKQKNRRTRFSFWVAFSILSSARTQTNVIFAGKCSSRRQSTTSFSENVVVAKTSYQMLEILSFSDRERA